MGKFTPHANYRGMQERKHGCGQRGIRGDGRGEPQLSDQDMRRRVNFVLVYFLNQEKEINLRP
jgi:hypothetical protein